MPNSMPKRQYYVLIISIAIMVFIATASVIYVLKPSLEQNQNGVVSLFVDPDSGCESLLNFRGQLIPRLDHEGHQICNKP